MKGELDFIKYLRNCGVAERSDFPAENPPAENAWGISRIARHACSIRLLQSCHITSIKTELIENACCAPAGNNETLDQRACKHNAPRSMNGP